ncbi:MAG: sigma-70 family RNA polymerase sigma factor [Chloroflexi bacterium]|nr:sigma-70 family RNA polymerase sigma factor [Chloroflexota bacterium]
MHLSLNLMPDNEHALVQRAVEHDSQAFTQLYDAYVDRVYKYVYYKVGPGALAEDLTAQVFLKAWEGIGRYQWTERPFAAWLFRIAHNLVVDHFRAQRPVVSIEDMELESHAAPLDDVAQAGMDRETIRRALERLTEDQRQVIVLKFLEGYETAQIAAMMGKEQTAIRALQHRALQALHQLLGRQGLDETETG